VDKERFQKLSEIFEAALATEYSLREEFVSVQCGADAELKKEVARLLLHHEDTGGVLEETQREVVTTLAPVLEGGPFKTPDRRVRHALSYWQLREDGADYLLSPTYAQVSRQSLTTLQIPAGVLLPSRTYHWRVLYVGTDRMAIGFTREKTFRTAEFPLEVVRFDLQKAFNRDVVANPDDDQDDAFDGDRRGLLLVHGFGAQEAKKQRARGLPPDRKVGVHELGDYSGPNSVQLSADEADPVRLVCRPHHSILLRFLVSGGNGDSAIPIQLEHTDGTRSDATVHCDDWFHDHPPDNIGICTPESHRSTTAWIASSWGHSTA
jgi:hypothetical protein